ncbi:MAG: hypothetical protein ACPIOQ_02010 [Promethearchaeia archaeon]
MRGGQPGVSVTDLSTVHGDDAEVAAGASNRSGASRGKRDARDTPDASGLSPAYIAARWSAAGGRANVDSATLAIEVAGLQASGVGGDARGEGSREGSYVERRRVPELAPDIEGLQILSGEAEGMQALSQRLQEKEKSTSASPGNSPGATSARPRPLRAHRISQRVRHDSRFSALSLALAAQTTRADPNQPTTRDPMPSAEACHTVDRQSPSPRSSTSPTKSVPSGPGSTTKGAIGTPKVLQIKRERQDRPGRVPEPVVLHVVPTAQTLQCTQQLPHQEEHQQSLSQRPLHKPKPAQARQPAHLKEALQELRTTPPEALGMSSGALVASSIAEAVHFA